MGDNRPASVFLAVPEVAALLGVPVSRVYSWTRQVGPDAIPCYGGAKRLRFVAEEVLAWDRRVNRREFRSVDRRRRRGAPDRLLGGQGGRRAVLTGVSANGPVAVALALPKEGS